MHPRDPPHRTAYSSHPRGGPGLRKPPTPSRTPHAACTRLLSGRPMRFFTLFAYIMPGRTCEGGRQSCSREVWKGEAYRSWTVVFQRRRMCTFSDSLHSAWWSVARHSPGGSSDLYTHSTLNSGPHSVIWINSPSNVLDQVRTNHIMEGQPC